MEHMLKGGTKFYTDQVEEWLDCGNKDAFVYTNQRVLEFKKSTEQLVSSSAVIDQSVVIPPCYRGEGVVIKNSVIGPYVSLEKGVTVEDARITNSVIQSDSVVKNAVINASLLGKNVTYTDKPEELSLGDFSTRI